MNKESLKPFVCRIIKNALRFKKYTKLPRGLLIYLDDKSGLGVEFFESLIKLAPIFVYKIRGGFRVTLFTGLNNKSIFIYVCKP